MKMKALKELRYASKMYKTGDEFEATDKDANLLKRIKRAENAPVESERKPLTVPRKAYVRRDLTAESVAPARNYIRRDMTAESDTE